MVTHFGVLNPRKKQKQQRKEDFPVRAGVSILLTGYTMARDHSIIIGPLMANESEIDFTIDELIRELEEVRKVAKKELPARVVKAAE
ncbi:MAG TPA: hypothetical protein VFK45_12245 [Gammaproteobacteria bacterium]|nr:hypothetical protein [Gammaproteobacteria bacterium]